ncbi:MAG: hypothetical protein ACK5IB_02555 [Qingshengfaniella sp.]
MTSADLRPSRAPSGTVVQTRLAALDAVLVIGAESLDIFADIASSHYMRQVFADRCPDWDFCPQI